jgi:hypothetical protein
MSGPLHAPLLQSKDEAHATSSSLRHIIQKAAEKFMHYVSLTCMFILPGFLEERPGGHAILYSVLTAVSFAVLAGTAVQKFHIRSIRMWPKVLDVATFSINIGLLIYTLISGKSAADLSAFLIAWGAFVQNVALLCVALGTTLPNFITALQLLIHFFRYSRCGHTVHRTNRKGNHPRRALEQPSVHHNQLSRHHRLGCCLCT